MPLNVLQGPIIEAGQSESHVLPIGDNFVVGLITPAEWSPAVVSVIVSPEGDNYYDLFDFFGREFVFNVIPNTMIIIDPNRLMCGNFLKLRSGTRDQPVPQAITRRFFVVSSSKAAVMSEIAELPPRRSDDQ